MKRIVLALVFALMATSAFAQNPLPTNYTLSTYNEANQAAPISTFSFSKAATQCDQATLPAPTGVIANPRYIRFQDPERPTRDCIYDTGTGTGPLFALPFGGRYVSKLVGTAVIGGVDFVSDASAASNPFVRGANPAVVLNLRLVGGSHD